MIYYRRILKIKWLRRISNKDVLDKIIETRTMREKFEEGRAKMIGHTLKSVSSEPSFGADVLNEILLIVKGYYGKRS